MVAFYGGEVYMEHRDPADLMVVKILNDFGEEGRRRVEENEGREGRGL